MSAAHSRPTKSAPRRKRCQKARAIAATPAGGSTFRTRSTIASTIDKRSLPIDNGSLAELLIREGEGASGHLQQAFRRAARNAFLWPEEAATIVAEKRALTALAGVGPYLAKRLQEWCEDPPSKLKPPPLRAEFLTLAEARAVLRERPKWRAQLKGDLQMHTTWSDGAGSVREMAEAAAELGHEYIAITDHTKGLKIAGGIDEERLAAQGREIRKVNAENKRRGLGITVLRSTEVNLSPLGEVDLAPAALGALDIVLGSFHSALRKTDDQTARYLAALRNPQIHILGHPQGRVYDYRAGLSADWPRVFAEAARLGKAVEINAYADRQDLKLSLLRKARVEGAAISLGTDAHAPGQLGFIELSLAAAWLARIPAEKIVNFMSLEKLHRWVASLRKSRLR